MPRRRDVPKREVLPDPKFGSQDVSKFINAIMQSGKKSVAERIVYGAFETIVAKGNGKDPLEVFSAALNNVRPVVEVKSRRVGGANYQVPVPVSGERRQILAMRWIRDACRKKKGKAMAEKLADELIDASNKVGTAIKKRDDTHRMAEANKAFAHFA